MENMGIKELVMLVKDFQQVFNSIDQMKKEKLSEPAIIIGIKRLYGLTVVESYDLVRAYTFYFLL